MSDTFLTADSAPSDAAGTATLEPTPSAGTAAPEQQVPEDGQPQGETEGSQPQGTQRRGKSLMDEVKELRAQRRELRDQVRSFDSVREELAQLREELNRRTDPNAAKTPANFWQDPEGALDRRLASLRDELSQTFQQTREQEYFQRVLDQERTSAAEFIRSQPNYDSSDDEELIEIIKELPQRTIENSSPMMIAEYAWMKYQQQKGVGDRTTAKHRASGVQGQPPGASFGEKRWSRQEFDAAVDLVEKRMRDNPNDPESNKLFKELEAAHKEGRVK